MSGKTKFLAGILIILAILLWQYQVYANEPKVLESTPFQFQNDTGTFNPYLEEPIRVVFDKNITVEDVAYSISPKANLEPKIRQSPMHSGALNFDKTYPTFVLKNKEGLAPNTSYAIAVALKGFNVFRFFREQPLTIYFKTNNELKPEKIVTGEEMEARKKESYFGSHGGDRDYNPNTLGPYLFKDVGYFIIDFIYKSDVDPKKDVVIVVLKGDQTRAKAEFHKFLKEKNIDQDLYIFEFHDQKTYKR